MCGAVDRRCQIMKKSPNCAGWMQKLKQKVHQKAQLCNHVIAAFCFKLPSLYIYISCSCTFYMTNTRHFKKCDPKAVLFLSLGLNVWWLIVTGMDLLFFKYYVHDSTWAQLRWSRGAMGQLLHGHRETLSPGQRGGRPVALQLLRKVRDTGKLEPQLQTHQQYKVRLPVSSDIIYYSDTSYMYIMKSNLQGSKPLTYSKLTHNLFMCPVFVSSPDAASECPRLWLCLRLLFSPV